MKSIKPSTPATRVRDMMRARQVTRMAVLTALHRPQPVTVLGRTGRIVKPVRRPS